MARHCALVPSPPLKNNPKTRSRPTLLAKPQMANWGQFLWKHCCVANRTCLCLVQKRIFHFFKKRECYCWWIISEGRAAVCGLSGTFWTRTWGLPFCFTDTYGASRTVASGWSQPEQTRRACPRDNSYTSSRQAAIVFEHFDIYGDLIPCSDNALCMYESAHPGRDLTPHLNVSGCFSFFSNDPSNLGKKRCRVSSPVPQVISDHLMLQLKQNKGGRNNYNLFTNQSLLCFILSLMSPLLLCACAHRNIILPLNSLFGIMSNFPTELKKIMSNFEVDYDTVL